LSRTSLALLEAGNHLPVLSSKASRMPSWYGSLSQYSTSSRAQVLQNSRQVTATCVRHRTDWHPTPTLHGEHWLYQVNGGHRRWVSQQVTERSTLLMPRT
jgi:hypothetical protein